MVQNCTRAFVFALLIGTIISCGKSETSRQPQATGGQFQERRAGSGDCICNTAAMPVNGPLLYTNSTCTNPLIVSFFITPDGSRI
jgi:hypothetical protein